MTPRQVQMNAEIIRIRSHNDQIFQMKLAGDKKSQYINEEGERMMRIIKNARRKEREESKINDMLAGRMAEEIGKKKSNGNQP